jgi:hypothetical protein
MTMSTCLGHCINWAGGKCRLENMRGVSFGRQDCPHFDQRVAGRHISKVKIEL